MCNPETTSGGTAWEQSGRPAGLGRPRRGADRAPAARPREPRRRTPGGPTDGGLLRRGDHVGCVSRLASCRGRVAVAGRREGTAESIESLTVLVEGRRVDELDRHAVSPPQQLRAHALRPLARPSEGWRDLNTGRSDHWLFGPVGLNQYGRGAVNPCPAGNARSRTHRTATGGSGAHPGAHPEVGGAAVAHRPGAHP